VTPGELKARVLHRDADILILDKPAGLAVHKGFGRGPTLDDFLDVLCFEAAGRPALAHRLDRETSGCLVLGRHREALRRLGRLFAQGRVEKIYWAIVEGAPPAEEGRIDLPLKKRSPDYGWWMAPDPEGQPAVTDYRLLGQCGARSVLELRPRTGRTHQLRAHCAAMACAVVGDTIYGPRAGQEKREPLLLHARAVTIPYDAKQPPVTAVAAPPPAMREALKVLGLAELA
jgi:RluA family pseudouridine synthase